jgi:hypothetical protein
MRKQQKAVKGNRQFDPSHLTLTDPQKARIDEGGAPAVIEGKKLLLGPVPPLRREILVGPRLDVDPAHDGTDLESRSTFRRVPPVDLPRIYGCRTHPSFRSFIGRMERMDLNRALF